MQTVTQLTTAISSNLASNSTPAPVAVMQHNSTQMQQPTLQASTPSEQLTLAIKNLFQKWKVWFKAKMKTRGEDFDWSFEMVLIWARYLTKKAITKTEFEVAEEKSFDGDWMPNNAQEFLALARKSSQPIYPTANDAFDNACNQCGLIEDNYVKRQWLHDVVQLTAHRIGMGRLKTADHKFLNYFKKIYEQVCSEHEAGELFLIPEERQIAHSHHPVEVGSEADKKISEQLAKIMKVAV